MAQVRIWVHAVWATKGRAPLLFDKNKRINIFKHIKANAREKGIYLDFINGVEDHVHVLLSLPPSISPAKAIQLIKGGSSRWMNEQHPRKERFSWQQGYAAFSLSPSRMKKTIEYIQNQEEHHKKVALKDE